MAEHFVKCSVKSAVCSENGQWPAVISSFGLWSLVNGDILFPIVDILFSDINPSQKKPPLY